MSGLQLPRENVLEVNERTLRTMVATYLRARANDEIRVTAVETIRRKDELIFRFDVTTSPAPVPAKQQTPGGTQ